jgi:hypothetical protein
LTTFRSCRSATNATPAKRPESGLCWPPIGWRRNCRPLLNSNVASDTATPCAHESSSSEIIRRRRPDNERTEQEKGEQETSARCGPDDDAPVESLRRAGSTAERLDLKNQAAHGLRTSTRPAVRRSFMAATPPFAATHRTPTNIETFCRVHRVGACSKYTRTTVRGSTSPQGASSIACTSRPNSRKELCRNGRPNFKRQFFVDPNRAIVFTHGPTAKVPATFAAPRETG